MYTPAYVGPNSTIGSSLAAGIWFDSALYFPREVEHVCKASLTSPLPLDTLPVLLVQLSNWFGHSNLMLKCYIFPLGTLAMPSTC